MLQHVLPHALLGYRTKPRKCAACRTLSASPSRTCQDIPEPDDSPTTSNNKSHPRALLKRGEASNSRHFMVPPRTSAQHLESLRGLPAAALGGLQRPAGRGIGGLVLDAPGGGPRRPRSRNRRLPGYVVWGGGGLWVLGPRHTLERHLLGFDKESL